VSNKVINKDTELVLDYGLETYWVAMERLIKDRNLICGLVEYQVKTTRLENNYLKAKLKKMESASVVHTENKARKDMKEHGRIFINQSKTNIPLIVQPANVNEIGEKRKIVCDPILPIIGMFKILYY
jgi:hypothetical protein